MRLSARVIWAGTRRHRGRFATNEVLCRSGVTLHSAEGAKSRGSASPAVRVCPSDFARAISIPPAILPLRVDWQTRA